LKVLLIMRLLKGIKFLDAKKIEDKKDFYFEKIDENLAVDVKKIDENIIDVEKFEILHFKDEIEENSIVVQKLIVDKVELYDDLDNSTLCNISEETK
jgi:hypothetical protein